MTSHPTPSHYLRVTLESGSGLLGIDEANVLHQGVQEWTRRNLAKLCTITFHKPSEVV